MIRFFDKAVQHGTGEDGLPVYAMVPYFEAYRSSTTHVMRPARRADAAEHPEAWDAYQKSREPDHEGYPLAAWPQIDDAERKGLAERGIHTLEKLVDADMAAAPVEFQEAQKNARSFLKNLHAEGPRLAARITELETENAGLKKQLGEAQKALDAERAKAAKPKGN